MNALPAETPLEALEWIPPGRRPALSRLGLHHLQDVLQHYPRRHEDRTRFDHLPQQGDGETVCLYGVITKTRTQRLAGWRPCFEAQMESVEGGPLAGRWTCRWFHSPYLNKMLGAGDRLIIYGKTKFKRGVVLIDHPEFEVLEEESTESLHFGRITPVYPAGEGISSRVLREIIHRALGEVDPASLRTLLPEAPVGLDRWEALRQLHFPESWETLGAARPRLILEEFFLLQARLFFRKQRESQRAASVKPEHPPLLQEFLERLPFAFTEGQEEVWREISRDLAAPRPMRRLLQGDVGSGKTVVAAAAAVQTIAAGWQAAFMAPTQILAEQHHRTLSAWLTPLGLRVGLFTGSRREVVGPADAPDSFTLYQESADLPDCDLLVGTHALLFAKAPVRQLGLVIIDEQHKFGVMQRQRLIERGTAPDVLVMSATPIPRTLTETVHGDLEVSLLRGRPAQRGRVITAVRRRDRLPAIIEFLHGELSAGRQLFIVYPLIEESEKLGAKAATVEVENWKKCLAPAHVEVLHGRIPPEEKERLMLRFAAQEFGVLVSTTVIEVGVDIPNATVMLIEDAERFGLAQLHQLRGRIGRGPYKSWCILLAGESAEAEDSAGWSKLGVLEKTSDGFEIAEADWALRGPGDMIGTAQSGLPPLRLGDLRRDAALMTQARERAAQLFQIDPALAQARHGRLRQWLQNQEAALTSSDPSDPSK